MSSLILDLGFKLGEFPVLCPVGKIPCYYSKTKPGWFQIWTWRFGDDFFFPASNWTTIPGSSST